MLRSKLSVVTVTTAVLGVATFGWARMALGEERAIPYQGVLERDGVAVTGNVTARFALFTSATTDTSCVLTNNCPLWSEEQDIDVDNGRFAVVLGDGDGAVLSDAVLASPALFLAVAVKTDDDADFTALAGVQEIVPVPLTARAALADSSATVVANGIDNAALQAGVVTRDKLANGTHFSALFVFNGATNQYTATNVQPPNWFRNNTTNALLGGASYTLNTFAGVSGYNCSATAVTNDAPPRVMFIAAFNNAQFLTVGQTTLTGAFANGSFALVCDAF